MTYKPPSAFLSLLIVGALLRLIFVFALPLYPATTILSGYNDEPQHLHYVRHIAEWNRLPIWYPEDSAVNPLVDEFIQAPLYYVLSVPFFKLGEWLHTGWGLYFVRLFSAFLGVVTALFVYWSAARVVRDVRIALAAFAVALFSPNAVVFSSIVTNDAGVVCLSAMAFHSLLLVREGFGGVFRQVKSGIFLGLAVWMKISALALLPLGLIAIPFIHRKSSLEAKGDAWMGRWRVMIVAIALVMPLIVWQSIHYRPEMMNVSRYRPETTLGVIGGGTLHPVMAAKIMLRTMAAPFDQVWGSIPEKVISSVWLLFAGVMVGVGSVQLIRSRERWMIFGGIGLMLAGFLFFNLQVFQVESRLLLPALAPLAILAAAGCEKLRLPIAVQAVVWVMPLLVVPFLMG